MEAAISMTTLNIVGRENDIQCNTYFQHFSDTFRFGSCFKFPLISLVAASNPRGLWVPVGWTGKQAGGKEGSSIYECQIAWDLVRCVEMCCLFKVFNSPLNFNKMCNFAVSNMSVNVLAQCHKFHKNLIFFRSHLKLWTEQTWGTCCLTKKPGFYKHLLRVVKPSQLLYQAKCYVVIGPVRLA